MVHQCFEKEKGKSEMGSRVARGPEQAALWTGTKCAPNRKAVTKKFKPLKATGLFAGLAAPGFINFMTFRPEFFVFPPYLC